MTDFYEQMAAVAAKLLAPTSEGGLGQGDVRSVTYTPAPPPANSWEPPGDPAPTPIVLKAAVRGVSEEYIGAPANDGSLIVGTDLQVIAAPWGGEYEAGAELQIDGKSVTVLRVMPIPAAGTVSAVKFIVR